MPTAWDALRGFEHFSLCDWPGRTTCVLFLGGCNFLCPTCHNGDIAWHQDRLPVFPRHLVEEYLVARRRWLDGIVVTGGEPTVVEGIEDLLRDLKQSGLPIKLDSNGMRPDLIESILKQGLADAFHVDVKGPFSMYPALAGHAPAAEAESAERNMRRMFALAEANPGVFTFRTTVVPRLTEDDLNEVRGLLPPGHVLKIQQFVAPKASAGSAEPQSADPQETALRRNNAETDPETRRLPGDLVHGQDSQCHSQGAQGQWH